MSSYARLTPDHLLNELTYQRTRSLATSKFGRKARKRQRRENPAVGRKAVAEYHAREFGSAAELGRIANASVLAARDAKIQKRRAQKLTASNPE